MKIKATTIRMTTMISVFVSIFGAPLFIIHMISKANNLQHKDYKKIIECYKDLEVKESSLECSYY